MEEKDIVTRERKVLDFFKRNFNIVIYFLLGIILVINVYLRTLPMRINLATGNPGLWDITRNNWTLGPDLDPFLFLRWAKTIIEQGMVPAIDTLRYSPLGYNTLLETKLLPYSIAYLYKFLNFFSSDVTIEYAAVILPVIASVFTAIAFFLLVRKIFENKGIIVSNTISIVATMFLVTLPSLLSRTIAGIPEKESLGFGLMFFALYFFLSAWKSKKISKAIILGVISGIFTAVMGLVWGVVIFVFAAIGVAGFISFILEKVQLKEFLVYSSWLLCSALFWLPFTARFTYRECLLSSTTGLAIGVLFLLGIYLLLFKTKLKDLNILQKKWIVKIPKVILVGIISLITLFILSSIFLTPSALFDFGQGVVSKLSSPYSDRLSFTVAENRQPFFSDWKQSFGPLFKGIPLFFWLFFVGSIFLFHEMVKGIEKSKLIIIAGYTLFLLSLIFSRNSAAGILNGTSIQSIFVYVGGFVILAVSFLWMMRSNKNKEVFKDIKFEYIFVFSLIFIAIIGARSGIRLIMLMAVIAVIPISYLFVSTIINSFNQKDDLKKLFFIALTVLLLITVPYTLFFNYKVTESSAKVMIPSSYSIQWQEAMGWVRENTPKDAVFSSWWDYGYWIQTMGERATMLDGGNTISYWDYTFGRHVLLAEDESEALELLFNHKVNYLLIDSTEIGKYSAFSSIGSDENYDRFSFLGTFVLSEAQSQQTENETISVYLGGIPFDEDILILNETVLLPKQTAGVGAIAIPSNNSGEFNQPYILVVLGQNQYRVNLRYLFYNGELIDFGSGIEAGVYLFPSLVSQPGQGLGINQEGAAIYLSPRNMKALWVRMYLLEEGEHFKLVHEESNVVIKGLRAQGVNIGEFVFFRGVMGPIKIWEVNYVGDEKPNEEYLLKTYPERLIDRRFAR